MRHGHERAEERNLALHRIALESFGRDPAGGRRKVLALLDRWSAMPHLERQRPLLDEWRKLLDLPAEDLAAALLGKEAQQLRQCSPLGVLISPQERFAVYRDLLRT